MLSRSHVSSMTGGCTCPISYRGVVSVEKESMIIRYKLAELIKKCLSREPSRSHVSSMPYGGESNHALPQPCFKHDRRMHLSDILPGSS